MGGRCDQWLDSCRTLPLDDRPSVSLYQDHLVHLNKQFKLPVIIVRETREKGRGEDREDERERGGWVGGG